MDENTNLRPNFTEEQKAAIFRAAGRKVACSVCRLANTITADDLAGAGEFPVYGAFVSLKRFGQLRACCGFLGENLFLADALDQAALRAAVEDFRFPVIQSRELHEMKMEVWILSGPERIVAKGPEIAKFIKIGKHGLQVFRGQQRGLLLPGVAIEMRLDPIQFLEHTCIKAGLPPNAWTDESTAVFRFEGYPITGNLIDTLDASIPLDPPDEGKRGPDARNLAWLADHCYQNIEKKLRGAIPDFYLPGAFDGPVNGACVRLKMRNQYMDCAHTSFNGEEPLQASLLKIAENAAASLAGHKIHSLRDIQAALCVFWDIHTLGPASRCNMERQNVNPRDTCVIVQRMGRWTLCFEPKKRPAELLADALERSQFPADETTAVYVAKVASTEPLFVTSTVQLAVPQAEVREPVVAGAFYPADVHEMRAELARMFAAGVEDDARPDVSVLTADEAENTVAELAPWERKFTVGPKAEYSGAVVPHAGWQYSGRLAAQTLSQIVFPKNVLVFAPKHRNAGVEWAVAPYETWKLPGRSMTGDPALAKQLAAAVPEFQVDALAHQHEHAIEVLLPILAELAPGSHVLGVVLHGWADRLPDAAKKLAAWLAGFPQKPLLLASTDMNHYATDRETRRKDAPVLRAMLDRDPEKMMQCVKDGDVSMCGCLPVALVMMTLRELGELDEAIPVGYCTSGDATGDKRQVVGYCGMLFK